MKKSYNLLSLNRKAFPNLVIIGGTASGKTTVAHQLAQLLGFGVIDLDAWIEKKAGRPIAAIFASEGEEAFRQMESDAIRSLGKILNHIVIPGGGALERDENWEMLKALGQTLWLATPLSEVVYRLMQDPEALAKRPKLAEALSIADPLERRRFLEQRLQELEERRMERYQAADYAVTIGFATAGTCAQFIKELLLSRQAPHNT